jgi:uncharacterized membrane protein YkvA (DUF1232 family)
MAPGPAADAPTDPVQRSDPFPRERLFAVLKRLPAYARLAYRLSREPDLPRIRRLALLGAFAYLVSPLDAIPGLIPVIGQIDDVLVVLLTLRFALGGLDPERRTHHLRSAGLTEAETAEDLDAIAAMGAWMLRAGGRTGARVSAAALDVGTRWGRRAAGGTAAVAGRAGSAGSERVRRAVVTRVRRPNLRGRGSMRPG